VVQVSCPSQVIKGTVVVIRATYLDTDHGNIVIYDANFTVLSGLEGVRSSDFAIRVFSNGTYELIMNTSWIPDNQLTKSFSLALSFEKSDYSSQVQLVSFKVVYQGYPLEAVVLAGGGGGGAVIIALLGFVMYRRARRPFVIKKIEASLKLISHGNPVEPIEGLRTRVETPLALLMPELESLGVKVEKQEPKPQKKKQEKPEKPEKKKSEKKKAKKEEKVEEKKEEAKPEEESKEGKETKTVNAQEETRTTTAQEEADKIMKKLDGGEQ
jgi:flagellar biosynthesis GTPase FlhF